MPDRLADWIALVDDLYPPSDAESWDASGLQVGDPADEVRAVLVALDVTETTLDEAVREGCQLLLAHHPLLFRPLRRLTPDTAPGRLALRAAREGVDVLAVHTNFDAAAEGTSEPVVHALDLRDVTPLSPLAEARVKLVVFVPPEATAAVLSAMSAGGGGVIGEYDECSFRVRGTGTFRPTAAASPTIGERGVRNEVEEDRVEMLVPSSRLGSVVEAMRRAHPYEEVAYDVVPLHPGTGAKGLGRIGTLPDARSVEQVAATLAASLPAPHLRVAGDLRREVRRVAVCAGAGDGLVETARRAGAELFVSGDLRHHVVLDALTLGLAVVDAGHHATEVAALPSLHAALTGAAAERGLSARLLPSACVTDPWQRWSASPRPQGGAR